MEYLFGGASEPRLPGAERVLMSLDEQWLELMFTGEKTHEFRKRYLLGVPTEWFVYLTAPTSRLAAIVELDPAIEGSAAEIGAIAELTKAGNGASVEAYLAQRGSGMALPIGRVREFGGFPLGSWPSG